MNPHPAVLVVSATRAEAAYVPAEVPLVITGIGKTAAATATARALAMCADPSSVTVINIGTAGALHDHFTGLYEPGVVLNHDLSAGALRALGYDPRERLVVGEGEITLATGDLFVTDPVVRQELARHADLVDMEGYAVAYAALTAGARFRAAKHVSDNADGGAMSWPQVVDASARVLADWLDDQL